MPNIPELKPHEGSYIVIRIETNEVITELFKDSPLIKELNFEKYKLVPIGEHLAGLSCTTED